MHYLGKMKIPKIAQMFRFTIYELANHEVKIGFKRACSSWLQLGMDEQFILANKLKLIRGCLCYDPDKSIALAPSGYQKFQFWAPL